MNLDLAEETHSARVPFTFFPAIPALFLVLLALQSFSTMALTINPLPYRISLVLVRGY
jgi:hypothetical protein